MKITELLGDALPIIKKFAPTIASLLTGQYAIAAEFLLPVIAKAFNAHPKNFGDLVTKIISDPDAQSKLEGIENEHCGWLCTTLDSVRDLASAEINIKLQWQNSKG